MSERGSRRSWRLIGRHREDRGAAIVEFALALPILAGLAIGILEFGFAWREGFFAAAVLGLVSTFFSDYRRLRQKLGLKVYAEADMLRQARRAAHWALEKLGDVKMEDVGVPRSRVPDMLRAVESIAAKHDVRIGTFGHAGDGNLHPDLVLDRGDPRGEAITKAVQADLYRAALDLGGTVTGEHGIGSARREWLEEQRGADAVRVMRAIKAALDPQGLFNPGKVL